MTTLAILIVYIIGIWVAFFQIQRWNGKEFTDRNESAVLFIMSTLSWAIYPIYLIVWIINKIEEE